ncbi:hypothetical protein [Negadavirga shengliensis]|uniref:Uncharacterized protein n=1 Tax=Negadavirga shengliensis TaxID=1389218 RepID=A0ABV9SZL1_9BACT
MKTNKINDRELKRFFSETNQLEKDLVPLIMKNIVKRSAIIEPAKMPASILWGIVILLLSTLSYALYHLDNVYFTYLEEIKWPKLPLPDPLIINPILVISSMAIVSAVWLVILLEKKLMGN